MASTLGEDVVDFLVNRDLEDPAGLYERMIREAPVLWCPLDGGFWIVSSYELATAVLGDSEHFIRGGRAAFDNIGRNGKGLEALRVRIALQDDPDHARLRSLVSRAFTPRAVARLRAQAVGVTERLLTNVYRRGEMEVLKEFSYPFTVEVIASMMGLPVADGPKLIEWTRATISAGRDDDAWCRAQEAVEEMSEYFLAHAYPGDRNRPDGTDGIISALAQAEIDGDRLSRAELIAVCWELVSAGHETTANMIPNALVTLLEHPAQLELLLSQPELLSAAVEESLRFQPPLPSPMPFTAVADVKLGTKMVARGDRVRVWISAANRDPAVFADPNVFDITRPNNRHLAFSHGSHFCLGWALARMEIEVALAGLLGLRDLALAGRPTWRRHTLRALEALAIRWIPQRPTQHSVEGSVEGEASGSVIGPLAPCSRPTNDRGASSTSSTIE